MLTTPRSCIEYLHYALLYLLVILLLADFCSGSYLHGQEHHDVGYSAFYDSYVAKTCKPTIALLAEQPHSMAKSVSSVPLLAVPQDSLKLVQDVPTHPVISLHSSAAVEQFHGMIPAIRVFLHRPMMVSSPESVITFPSGFTVVHDGLPILLDVSAVIAPLPSGTYFTTGHPIAVRVVYALSINPLHVQGPVHHAVHNRKPVSETSPAVTTPSLVTALLPVNDETTLLPSRPQQTVPQYPSSDDSNLVAEGVRPGVDTVVTVLDFPSAVASPSISLFPQLSLDEGSSELGNREPPQAAVPAGIIQSTAPLPNLSIFVNSKESSVLQTLRDEAERNKTQNQDIETSSIRPIEIDVLDN